MTGPAPSAPSESLAPTGDGRPGGPIRSGALSRAGALSRSGVLSRAGVVAAAVVVLFLAPFLLGDYATITLARILVTGLLAVSVAVLTGVAGLPTLGQTAPFLVGAYTAALLTRDGMTVGLLQLLVAALIGAAFAAVTAPLVVRARGTVVLMITLALGELTNILAGRWKAVTNGTDGMLAFASITPLPGLAPLVTDGAVYQYVLLVTGVLLAVVLLVLRSPAGALLRATRDNEARMRASGHPVAGYLAVAYIGAGALAGVAGALLVTVQDFVSPANGGFDTAALVLLAVVIGGATSMVGAFVGAALVVATRDWLAGPLPGHANLLLGVLFILCVYLLPGGLFGRRPPRPSLWRRRPTRPERSAP